MNAKKISLNIFFSFFILFIIEIFLNISGYGKDLSHLFLETSNGNYLYLNQDVCRRYFTSTQSTTGNVEYFLKEKTKNTVRIFVLGESAALGFPYPNNISFSRMLKYKLQELHPQKNIEVINLSFTAISSYTFLDFSKELLNYEPDAICVYGGHNEFYGALGVASKNSCARSRFLTSLSISLRKLKLSQLINSIVDTESLDNLGKDNLMKYVVNDFSIKYNGELFKLAMTQFQDNLSKMLSLFNERQIPVFISTVPVNLLDQVPFHSIISSVDTVEYVAELKKSKILLAENNCHDAFENLKKLYEEDSLHAEVNYLLGKISLIKHDTLVARNYFFRAKQYDALRFRAPSEINDIIREFPVYFNNVYLVDTEKKFEECSVSHFLPGNDLFLEHVHPTIKGHKIIASSFLNVIEETFFNVDTTKSLNSLVNFDDYPVLLFDSLVGAYSCDQLRKGFPFYERNIHIKRPVTQIEKMSMHYVFEKNWYKSMSKLQDYAIETKDALLLLDILRVRVIDNPYDSSFLNQLGAVADYLGRYELALFSYERSFLFGKDLKQINNIISTGLKSDNPEKIVKYIDYAIVHNIVGLDFRKLRTICLKIIDYKKQLENSSSQDIREEIKRLYLMMGNEVAAKRY